MINAITALDQRIKNTIETTSSIHQELHRDSRDPALNVRIESLIKTLEKCCTARDNLQVDTEYDDLDHLGVKLWNLATQLSKEDDTSDGVEDTSSQTVILNVRILAFFLLDCAERPSGRTRQSLIRLLKVALKTGRECIDQKQLSWALKIMEKAARYHEDLGKLDESQSTEGKVVFHRLEGEYYLLRMTIAWKQSNLSMVEFMYGKALVAHGVQGNTGTSEALAKVILKIGNGLLAQNAFVAAVKWLRRALEVLDGINPICLTKTCAELHYSVLHSLVTGCLQTKTEAELEYARNALETMSENWPTRISILRLKLDLITMENSNAVDEYHKVLLKMIEIAQFSEDVFRTVLGRIQKLSDKSVTLACNCLDEMISKRLLVLEQDEWVERAFVTRLWMSVKNNTSLEGTTLAVLKKLVDSMSRQLSKPLSPKSTHAAQILLWKVSEAFLAQEKWLEASEWCEVALHRIFDKSGDLNYAKLRRRIIHCAIQIADYGKATEVYADMSESSKQSPSTLFLMFKVALRTSNHQLAESTIRGICETPLRDHRALYACALDAHTLGNEGETLGVLKHVLRHMDDLPTESIHKPAVLRCTIRLTIGIIDRAKGAEISNAESLCQLLELASAEAKKTRGKKSTVNKQDISFTVKELEWFSRTSYNLGLRSIEEWPLTTSIRIVSICLQFLELYPDDIDASTRGAISLKAIYCHFLNASLGIQIAREEDNTNIRVQSYFEVKQQIQAFRMKRQALKDDLVQEVLWDLKDKHATLLLYEFEACVHLKDWDYLSTIVGEAQHCENPRVVQYFGDMIMQSQAPDRTIMPIMKKILEALILSPNENMDVVKLARCVRCQVQLSLIRDPKVTAQLIGEVLDWARGSKGEEKYPEEELRWLATTAWNKAVEFKGVTDATNFKKFGELAISVAKLMEGDGGKLLARMQKNYIRDNWD
ncbi:meiosis protein SPO22/ZIP4 like-domain-containing protein [Tirmania nivea]|nr:meiosis protein SPO22/ZIP4 like-domain-containing protein [Tirmania nivea]